MRCPKCGANVPDGKSKCPYCFSPLTAQSAPSFSYSRTNSQQEPSLQANVTDVYERNVGGVAIINNEEGVGSGFLITRDGCVLTNGHMVYDKRKRAFYDYVEVIFNGKQYSGKVIRGNVPRQHYHGEDVALVKIEDEVEGTVLSFGDSSKLRNGEEVIAIGNSLGLGISVSRGIISDTRKMIGFSTLLTSDVATNHGNSGGPLFDTKGRVIAMCVSGVDGAKGMNFFIPINHVLEILEGWGYKF